MIIANGKGPSFTSNCVKNELDEDEKKADITCGCHECLKKEFEAKGFIKGGKIRRLA